MHPLRVMLIWPTNFYLYTFTRMLFILRGDSMKNTVIIKGNKYGITIVLDKEIAFSQLLKDLSIKLENAEEFFDSDKQLAVTFEGRELSNEEMDELLYVITENSKLNIQYVMDHNDDVEATFFDIIQTAKALDELEQAEYPEVDSEVSNLSDIGKAVLSNDRTEDSYEYPTKSDYLSENNGLFYKGTLRSGQSLDAKESIIIIGDVNPGATITANGNIVIIGSLKGSVHAGHNGNTNAFVMALSMSPMRLQIADIVANSSDTKKIPKSKKDDAMIATIMNDQITIERVSKATI